MPKTCGYYTICSDVLFSDEEVQQQIARCGETLSFFCFRGSYQSGWWHNENHELKDRNVPEMLMLMVSEIAEAMEGYRKDLQDDKLPHRKMLETELADAAIRIFDFAGGFGLHLGVAIAEKLVYNQHRLDHKPEERAKTGGKKF